MAQIFGTRVRQSAQQLQQTRRLAFEVLEPRQMLAILTPTSWPTFESVSGMMDGSWNAASWAPGQSVSPRVSMNTRPWGNGPAPPRFDFLTRWNASVTITPTNASERIGDPIDIYAGVQVLSGSGSDPLASVYANKIFNASFSLGGTSIINVSHTGFYGSTNESASRTTRYAIGDTFDVSWLMSGQVDVKPEYVGVRMDWIGFVSGSGLSGSINASISARNPSELALTSLQWDPINGGLKGSYNVTGSSVPRATTIGIYWNGNSLIPTAPIIVPVNQPTGTYYFYVPANQLTNVPSNPTHLTAVIDPISPEYPDGLNRESNEFNNSFYVLDVQLSGPTTGLTTKTKTVLKEVLRAAGQSSATVTSTYRTEVDQARVMFEVLEGPLTTEMAKKYTSTLDYSYGLYDANGEAVIAEYVRLKAQPGADATQIKQGMTNKIREIKLSNPSAFKHTADPTVLQVIDLDHDSMANPRLFEEKIKSNTSIPRHYSPYTKPFDKAFHIEIPQGEGPVILPSSGSGDSTSDELATNAIESLTPATPINVSASYGKISDSIAAGHKIFSFNARAGDFLGLSVSVTQIFTGSTYTDNDTVLFLFDPNGKLLATNDDTDPFESDFQSKIDSLELTLSGTYYAVVTTFGNNPILDQDGVVTGWEDDGGSSVAFELGAYVNWSIVPGDYNFDGNVDAADFVTWRKTNGSDVPSFTGADGNGDGKVDSADYNVWRSNYGLSVATTALGSIDDLPIRSSLAAASNRQIESELGNSLLAPIQKSGSNGASVVLPIRSEPSLSSNTPKKTLLVSSDVISRQMTDPLLLLNTRQLAFELFLYETLNEEPSLNRVIAEELLTNLLDGKLNLCDAVGNHLSNANV